MTQLSESQERALAALDFDQPTTCDTLAEALDTSPEGAARTASSLVRRGLAARVDHEGHVAYLRGVAPEDGEEILVTDEARASLALLNHLGGKAYCAKADDERRTAISTTSALALERAGFIELQHRPSYMVAVLLESEVPA